ncbi:MAG: hypothetical protein Q9170_002836 [Blastenia crenularia]
MAFEIAEAQEADLPELARLADRVWTATPWVLMGYMFPINDPVIRYAYRLKRLSQSFQLDYVKHYKIIDTSNHIIISYAAWELPRPHSSSSIPDSESPDTRLPEGSNVQLIKDFWDERDRIKAKHTDETQDYYLRSMLTHPEYQGQGLASMLLRSVLAKLDAERRRCYLEASPAGLPIYRHLGWHVVDEIKTDLDKYGVVDARVDTTPCMLREARDTEATSLTIPPNSGTVQASTMTDNINLAEFSAKYSIPRISLQPKHHSRALAPRVFKSVPDLPQGWKAVFGTSKAMIPVYITAAQLRIFYAKIAYAALDLDDRWRWTIQIGQLVLQLTSRDRSKAVVTKELILATVFMLKEFANGGFTDLFVARLWDELDGTVVDIQLKVAAAAVEGMKVS